VLLTRVPRRDLSPYVESLWYYESHHAHAREIVLPSTRVQLLLHLSAGSARVVGPTTQPTMIETAQMRRMVGVTFRAGSAQPFIAVPCNKLCDRTIDFSALAPASARELTSRVGDSPPPERMLEALEKTLLGLAATPSVDHAMIAAAVRWLDSGARVADVIERVGVSRSRFVRTFAALVGTNPKTHASLGRFRRALTKLAAGDRDLVGIAADCGYFDQAHFCHEFQRLAGRSPTAYQPRDAAEPSHLVA
jgi:AraC-like DNA-binding protein